jgi:hypothetical protein
MDKGQIGHVRPHLKRFGDFTINVVFAHIRRVLLNGISYLFIRPTIPCSNATSNKTKCNTSIFLILHIPTFKNESFLTSGETWMNSIRNPTTRFTRPFQGFRIKFMLYLCRI